MNSLFVQFLSHMSVQSNLQYKMKMANLLSEVTKLMQVLLQHAFVVVEQPCSSILKHDPLTIISNAKFEVKLALLVDHQLVGLLLSHKCFNYFFLTDCQHTKQVTICTSGGCPSTEGRRNPNSHL